jgi:hypothetical protein
LYSKNTMKIQKLFWLTAGLAVPGLTAASFVQNPSFESNYNDVFPGYSAIDLWNGGSGVNELTGPFHNGPTAIPDRNRVAFVQGSAALSQEIFGLTPGNQYWIQFWYDARNCCGGTIDIVTSFAEVQLDRISNVRPAMLNERPYHSRSISFVADAESGLLTFTTIASGDATALFDAVTIVERDTNNVTVLNPSFEGSGVIPAAGDLLAISGWEVVGIVGVDDGSVGHADNGAIPEQDLVAYIQGAGSLSQNIANLIVGRTYEVSLAYNAQSGTTPNIQMTVGDEVLFSEDVAPVEGGEPYRTRTASFVATDLSAVLSIAQTKDGSDVLLVDNVRVEGETTQPLPPLEISPNAGELAPGQRLAVTITVPNELLAIKAATLTFRSPNTDVLRLVNANAEGLLALEFTKDGTNVATIELEAVGRGTTRLEVVDAAGLTIERDLAVSVVTSFVRNPSFESSAAPAGVGYGGILAWNTPPAGVGLNTVAGPFHDNGAIPDRAQVAFIQNTATISQEIAGLTPGENYWLQFYYNVRNCCDGTMDLEVRFDGTVLTNFPQIFPVGDVNSYYFAQLDFAPTNSSGLLEFAATAVGDASLLLDAVSIVQREAGVIVIKNPSFEASGSPASVGYVQPNNIAGWDAVGGGRGINVNGAGPFTDNGLASDQDLVLFMQNPGTSISQIVSGFEPAQEYTLIFDVNGRSCCGPEPTAYRVLFNDEVLVEEEIMPVGAGVPFIAKYLPFTATVADGILMFEHTTPEGDHTLLLDNIRIVKGRAVQAPRLTVLAADGNARIAWPADATGFSLESSAALPGGWTPVATVPMVEGNETVILEPIGAGNRYYRLVAP